MTPAQQISAQKHKVLRHQIESKSPLFRVCAVRIRIFFSKSDTYKREGGAEKVYADQTVAIALESLGRRVDCIRTKCLILLLLINQLPSDMLFLVSGTSRSGKTLVARKLLADRQIPYLSVDWLMMGFNDGMPELGIHHLLWPNEIAERMGPFLRGMIDCMLVDGMDYVIEGEAMLPRSVADLVEDYPGRIRAVFLGYTRISVEDKLALVRKHADIENDWLTRESDEYIRDHIGNMVAYGKTLKNQCETRGLPYFDTSEDFLETIAAATDFLVADLK